MFALIGLAGFLGFFVGLVLLILSLIKKRPKRKSQLFILISVVMFFVGIFMTPEVEKPDGGSDSTKSTSSATSNDDASAKEAEPSNSSSSEPAPVDYFGELLDKTVTKDINPDGDICVLKFKIEPNLTNRLTIQQNYHNVEKFILQNSGDQFAEIQYWAVSDMSDGTEGKVISFTLNSSTIKAIADKTIVASQLEDHVDDLWILPSLSKANPVPIGEPASPPSPAANEASSAPKGIDEAQGEYTQSSEPQNTEQSYVPEQHETTDQEQVVYWGASGTKYHIDPNCRSFQGNTPNSGSIEDAIAAGRTGWCGICSK